MKVDLLIKNCLVVTFNQAFCVYQKGFIAVKNNKIFDIGDVKNCNYTAIKEIDATGKIAMPGLINMHTHIGMTGLRGYADDMPLNTWLNNYIWPAEAKMVCAESVYKASLNGIYELIKNGISCFNDMYFFEKETAKAAIRLNMRAFLSEGILDFPIKPHNNSDEMIQYCCESKQMFKNNPIINFCLGPHSIYVCSKQNLQKVKAKSKLCDMPVHIHVAETKHELTESLKLNKKSPVAYLHDLNLLNSKALLAHCVWIDDADIDLLKQTKANVIVNTKSNLKLASGVIPLVKLQKAGVNYCLGTDSVASNNRLSILSEANITALLHKGVNLDASVITAKQILTAATKNAGIALNTKIGQLEKDFYADILLLDMENPEFLPHYDIYSYIVYSINEKAINSLYINGKAVMENKKVYGIEEAELKENIAYIQKKLDFKN